MGNVEDPSEKRAGQDSREKRAGQDSIENRTGKQDRTREQLRLRREIQIQTNRVFPIQQDSINSSVDSCLFHLIGI